MNSNKSGWLHLMRLILSNSIASLAQEIETHGIYCKDDYGRTIKAPDQDASGGNKSVAYALQRLREKYSEQCDPSDNNDYEFYEDDQDPLYYLGWEEADLPPNLKTEINPRSCIEQSTAPESATSNNNFVPRTPSGLAELFKCYDEKQWKRLSKNCKKTEWLRKALAERASGSSPHKYYPDMIADELVKKGKISQDHANKILLKEAPEHLKDYYRES